MLAFTSVWRMNVVPDRDESKHVTCISTRRRLNWSTFSFVHTRTSRSTEVVVQPVWVYNEVQDVIAERQIKPCVRHLDTLLSYGQRS